jgi:hypothetical protein
MKMVIIESPFAGDRITNLNYLGLAIRDCIQKGETPYASHAIIPLGLDDNDPKQRDAGIQAGFVWRQVGELTIVYADFGISRGMDYGILDSEKKNRKVIYRMFVRGVDRPAEDIELTSRTQDGQVLWTAKSPRGGSASSFDKSQAFKGLSILTPDQVARFQALQRLSG